MEDTNIIEEFTVTTDEFGEAIIEPTQDEQNQSSYIETEQNQSSYNQTEQNQSDVVPVQVPDPQQTEQQKENDTNTIPEETEIIDDAAKEGVNDNFLEDVIKILLKDKVGDTEEKEEEEEEENMKKGDEQNETYAEISSGNSGNSDIDYSGILGDISGKLDNNN